MYLTLPNIIRYREVRGDGNCFYRAIFFGFFERIFTKLNDKKVGSADLLANII